jgi:hypothetical protein
MPFSVRKGGRLVAFRERMPKLWTPVIGLRDCLLIGAREETQRRKWEHVRKAGSELGSPRLRVDDSEPLPFTLGKERLCAKIWNLRPACPVRLRPALSRDEFSCTGLGSAIRSERWSFVSAKLVVEMRAYFSDHSLSHWIKSQIPHL